MPNGADDEYYRMSNSRVDKNSRTSRE